MNCGPEWNVSRSSVTNVYNCLSIVSSEWQWHWSWSLIFKNIQIAGAEQRPGGGAPVTDHILYLISDLQTLSAALIGQSEPMLGSHWSADNERCPHGTEGQLGRGGGAALFDLKEAFYGGFTKWVYNARVWEFFLKHQLIQWFHPTHVWLSEKKLAQTRTRIELLDHHNGCINSSSWFL